jgi:hypothetical protein
MIGETADCPVIRKSLNKLPRGMASTLSAQRLLTRFIPAAGVLLLGSLL